MKIRSSCRYGITDEDVAGFFKSPRVIFRTFDAGYDCQSKQMRELGFVVGQEYTIESVDVGDSSSSLKLVEFPNKSFNTVFFENV
jgi:hypothetical protein